MNQINYTTDKDGNVIDGDKSEIVDVNEKWTFTHSIISNNKTWFVDKIEEC
jgi:predicted lipid-binding transport protein (Tim44 family)